jgi:hypothetical protein
LSALRLKFIRPKSRHNLFRSNGARNISNPVFLATFISRILAMLEPKPHFIRLRSKTPQRNPRRWKQEGGSEEVPAPDWARFAVNQFQRRQQTANGPFRQRRTGNKPVKLSG